MVFSKTLCCMLLIIPYQIEGKTKTYIHKSFLDFLDYISLCLSTPWLFLQLFLILLCKPFSSSPMFSSTLLSHLLRCLAKNQLCRVKYKGPATVNNCSIIGVSAGRWWITLMTVLIWVLVAPSLPLAHAVSSVEANCIIKKRSGLNVNRRGFSVWAC